MTQHEFAISMAWGFLAVYLFFEWKYRARTLALIESRTAARVVDDVEFQCDDPHQLTWGLTTPAEVDLSPPRTALLHKGGQRLQAVIESPSNATWRVAACGGAEPEASNHGYRRLEIELSGLRTAARIAVRFTPQHR